MFSITCISVDEEGRSVFVQKYYEKTQRAEMWLSDQIGAKNFRFRSSEPGYKTTWHLAGDPTLIIIQKGILRITLRDNSFKDFRGGDMFIAADNIVENTEFNTEIHGHIAEVIGNETLEAVHIKLADFKV